jgi:hypothetical protein
MTNQVIPAEAVEAAAKAMFYRNYPIGSGVSWDLTKPATLAAIRDAEIALYAAAPFMRKRAFPSFDISRWRK